MFTLQDLVEIVKWQWEGGYIKPWPTDVPNPFKFLVDQENQIVKELREAGLSIEGMREEQLAANVRELKRIHNV